MTDTLASTDGGQGGASAAVASPINVVPVTPTGAQVTTPPVAPIASPIDWLKGADDVTVGYVQNKGWTEPNQLLDGYRNLEKLLGADKANNSVIIPRGDADPKEWAAVYEKMGRPSGADGYKVELPKGGDAGLHSQVMAKMHELGLSKAQGESLANWYNGLGTEALQAQETQRNQAFQADDLAVKAEWGQAYTQNLAQAQQAARGLGLDADSIDKMSESLGHKATMQLLQKIGSRMGEDSFVTGEGTEKFGNALTPGQAKSEIQSLMSDKDFTKKYLSGDVQSKERMSKLHQFAFPEG